MCCRAPRWPRSAAVRRIGTAAAGSAAQPVPWRGEKERLHFQVVVIRPTRKWNVLKALYTVLNPELVLKGSQNTRDTTDCVLKCSQNT